MAEYLCEEDMSTGEYISRDVALRQLNATCLATDCNNYNGVRCRACAYADAMDFIDAIPAADVQPVKRGNWVQIGEQSAKCTECGGVLKSNGIDKTGKALIFNAVYHYCPYCGARMDGDTE